MSKTELESKSLTPLEFFEEKKKYISNQYNKAADKRDFWIKKNKYYYDYLTKVLRCIVEPQSKVLQIKCETGYFLNAVNVVPRVMALLTLKEFFPQKGGQIGHYVLLV